MSEQIIQSRAQHLENVVVRRLCSDEAETVRHDEVTARGIASYMRRVVSFMGQDADGVPMAVTLYAESPKPYQAPESGDEFDKTEPATLAVTPPDAVVILFSRHPYHTTGFDATGGIAPHHVGHNDLSNAIPADSKYGVGLLRVENQGLGNTLRGIHSVTPRDIEDLISILDIEQTYSTLSHLENLTEDNDDMRATGSTGSEIAMRQIFSEKGSDTVGGARVIDPHFVIEWGGYMRRVTQTGARGIHALVAAAYLQQ